MNIRCGTSNSESKPGLRNWLDLVTCPHEIAKCEHSQELKDERRRIIHTLVCSAHGPSPRPATLASHPGGRRIRMPYLSVDALIQTTSA